MTEEGKPLFYFSLWTTWVPCRIIPFKIADRSKKTPGEGRGERLPSRRAAERDQLEDISVEPDRTKPPPPASLHNGHSSDKSRSRSQVFLVTSTRIFWHPRGAWATSEVSESYRVRRQHPPLLARREGWLFLSTLWLQFNPTAFICAERHFGKQPHPRGCGTGCDFNSPTGRSKRSPAGGQVRESWKCGMKSWLGWSYRPPK